MTLTSKQYQGINSKQTAPWRRRCHDLWQPTATGHRLPPLPRMYPPGTDNKALAEGEANEQDSQVESYRLHSLKVAKGYREC